jgi:hypothetical protein
MRVRALLTLLALLTFVAIPAWAVKERIYLQRPNRTTWVGANVRAYPCGDSCGACLTGGLAAHEDAAKNGVYYWSGIDTVACYDVYANGVLILDSTAIGTVYGAGVGPYIDPDSAHIGVARIDTLYVIHAEIDTVYLTYGLGVSFKADTIWAFKYLRSDDSVVVKGGMTILKDLLVSEDVGARGVAADSATVATWLDLNGSGDVAGTLTGKRVWPDTVRVNYKFVVPVFAGDPGDLIVGMMWYNTSAQRLSYYDGAVRRLEQE